MFVRPCAVVLTLAAAIAAGAPAPVQGAPNDNGTLTVFAAASLRNALDEANAAFTKTTGIEVVVSHAATSALVKQIAAGAPADVFVAADRRWMDDAVAKILVRPDTRIDLLGNRLVLIAPGDSELDAVAIAKSFDIARLAGDGRIAIANVAAVPAGRYAQAALMSLGVWDKAKPKLAQAQNVRAALAYVARGETSVGIVYATDAKAEPKVKVIGVFPESSHPAIVYPAAITSVSDGKAPMRYLEFLQSSAARAIFEKHGFSFLIRPRS